MTNEGLLAALEPSAKESSQDTDQNEYIRPKNPPTLRLLLELINQIFNVSSVIRVPNIKFHHLHLVLRISPIVHFTAPKLGHSSLPLCPFLPPVTYLHVTAAT